MPCLIPAVPGQIYDLHEIFHLDLDDSPHLLFVHEDHRGVIQHSHITNEELLSVPGFKNTRWLYRRRTHEWISLFMFVGEEPITNYITIEPTTPESHNSDHWWACPIGFYQEQYKD